MLEHELGHVIGLADNTEAGDLMDITLGLGVRRAPTSADLATIAGASSTAVRPHRPRSSASRSCSTGRSPSATMDAALASIVSTARGNGDDPESTVKPAARARSVGPVSGPGVTSRKKGQSSQL